MASGPAETHRIHIFDSAVRRGPNNKKVQYGGEDHPLQGPPHNRQTEVDGWKRSRQSAAPAQTPSSEPDAKRNQQQTEYENAREDQENQKAIVVRAVLVVITAPVSVTGFCPKK